ncbi:MAG: DUF4124 domain-containing protein [Candidatus Competibacteraceae bacterium]
MQLLLLLSLVVFLPSAVAQEAIYRWQDAQGNIHYGSKPPADVRAESMGTRTQPLTVNPDESVYTWKDEKGHIHYGDHPPPGTEAKSLDTSTSPLSTIRKTEMRAGEQQLLEGTQR